MTTNTVVCIYSHRHGVDVWSFDNLASAHQIVATEHVMSQLDAEVSDPERRTKIRVLIEAREYEEAISEYNEAQLERGDREDFEFYETEVQKGAPPKESERKPMCPKCTSTALDDFEIMESYTAYHPVQSVNEHGMLEIENALTTTCPSEHFDDGASDYRVHCRSCMHEGTPAEFHLPEEWDWV